MQYLQEINLELNSNAAYTTVGAKQGDHQSRVIKIHITENGQDWSIPNGAHASYRVRKPDGYAIWNEASIDFTENVVYITLTEQTLAVAGRAYADLLFVQGTGEEQTVLSTVSFIIIIMASPDITRNVESSDEFTEILSLTDNADVILNESEAWAVGTKAGVPIVKPVFEYTVEGGSFECSIDQDIFHEKVGTSAGYTRFFIFTCLGVTEGTTELRWRVEQGNTILNDIDLAEYGITITSGIPLQSNIIRVVVTDQDIQYENNSLYYAEQARISQESIENMTVSSETLTAGSSVTVIKTIDSTTGIVNLDFGIPQGIKGENGTPGDRGPSTVWVDTEAPVDSAYTVWLNPDGTDTPILLSAEQMTYKSIQFDYEVETGDFECLINQETFCEKVGTAAGHTRYFIFSCLGNIDESDEIHWNLSQGGRVTSDIDLSEYGIMIISGTPIQSDAIRVVLTDGYDADTIGAAVNQIENQMGAINEVADEAEAAAARAEAASSQLEEVIEQIVDKITCPEPLPEDTGFLQVKSISSEIEGEDPTPEFSWKAQLDYDNDLINLPQIEGITLSSNLTLDDLGIAPSTGSPIYYQKPEDGIPTNDLTMGIAESLDLANSAVQQVHMNGQDFQPVDGTVDLGISGIQTIKMNNADYNPTNGIVDLGTLLTEQANTNIGPNYLDNAWFTINQRGITHYNGDSENAATLNTYICDRWKITDDETPSSNRAISIENHILTIGEATNPDVTKTFGIGQIINDEYWQQLSNRDVIASINFKLNTEEYITKSFYFKCPTYSSDDTSSTNNEFVAKFNLTEDPDTKICEYGWGLYINTTVIDNHKYLVFSIIWADNVWGESPLLDGSISIAKTKLELGVFSTLDLEVMPSYDIELAKCQKYLRIYGGLPSSESYPIAIGHGIAASTTLLEWGLFFKESMIKNPTITSTVSLSAKRGLTATTSAGSITASNLANSTFFAGVDCTLLQTTASSLTASIPYYIILPATASVAEGAVETLATLTFNAEL